MQLLAEVSRSLALRWDTEDATETEASDQDGGIAAARNRVAAEVFPTSNFKTEGPIMMCRHCQRVKFQPSPGPLLVVLLHARGVREKFPSTSKFARRGIGADFNGRGFRLPGADQRLAPGTEEKGPRPRTACPTWRAAWHAASTPNSKQSLRCSKWRDSDQKGIRPHFTFLDGQPRHNARHAGDKLLRRRAYSACLSEISTMSRHPQKLKGIQDG